MYLKILNEGRTLNRLGTAVLNTAPVGIVKSGLTTLGKTLTKPSDFVSNTSFGKFLRRGIDAMESGSVKDEDMAKDYYRAATGSLEGFQNWYNEQKKAYNPSITDTAANIANRYIESPSKLVSDYMGLTFTHMGLSSMANMGGAIGLPAKGALMAIDTVNNSPVFLGAGTLATATLMGLSSIRNSRHKIDNAKQIEAETMAADAKVKHNINVMEKIMNTPNMDENLKKELIESTYFSREQKNQLLNSGICNYGGKINQLQHYMRINSSNITGAALAAAGLAGAYYLYNKFIKNKKINDKDIRKAQKIDNEN